jgi:hypothetical protein
MCATAPVVTWLKSKSPGINRFICMVCTISDNSMCLFFCACKSCNTDCSANCSVARSGNCGVKSGLQVENMPSFQQSYYFSLRFHMYVLWREKSCSAWRQHFHGAFFSHTHKIRVEPNHTVEDSVPDFMSENTILNESTKVETFKSTKVETFKRKLSRLRNTKSAGEIRQVSLIWQKGETMCLHTHMQCHQGHYML